MTATRSCHQGGTRTSTTDQRWGGRQLHPSIQLSISTTRGCQPHSQIRRKGHPLCCPGEHRNNVDVNKITVTAINLLVSTNASPKWCSPPNPTTGTPPSYHSRRSAGLVPIPHPAVPQAFCDRSWRARRRPRRWSPTLRGTACERHPAKRPGRGYLAHAFFNHFWLAM